MSSINLLLRIYLSIYSSILFIRTVWADKLRVESIIYHSETFYSYAFFSSKCSHDYKEKKLWLFLKCNCLQLSTYNVQAKVLWLFRIQQVITIIPLCKCFMRTGDNYLWFICQLCRSILEMPVCRVQEQGHRRAMPGVN